ncbi:hypothetical protein GCM10010321_36440 [Streptomyces chartreusis]|nr:hypothetical protein GCM10010321_36440 [Streptomyces chartreusis]
MFLQEAQMAAHPVRWTIAVVASVTVFCLCLWGAHAVRLGWMPSDETDRWSIAATFATVSATVVAAALGWWAQYKAPSPGAAPPRIAQRAKVVGQGHVEQVGGSRNMPPGLSRSPEPPHQVEQHAEASGSGRISQAGGDQYIDAPGPVQP